MMLRRFLLVGCGLIACTGVFAEKTLVQQLPEALLPGLSEILEAAVEESSAMRLRAFSENESEGHMKIAGSRKKLRVNTIASYRKEEALESADIPGAYSGTERLIYSVNLNQPIYHWGVLKAQKKAGKIGYENALVSTGSEFGNLALDIRNRYLDLVVAKQRIRLVEETIALKQKEIDTEQVRADEGFVPHSRVSGLKFSLSQTEIDNIRKQTDYKNRLSGLVSKSGVEANVIEASLVDSIPLIDRFLEDEINLLRARFDEAIHRSDRTKLLDNNIEIARLYLHQVNNRLKPNLDLTSGITQNERDISGRITEEQFAFAGVTVRWNIFDGHETAGYKSLAISRLQRAEEARLLYGKSFNQDLENALTNFDMASRMLDTAEYYLRSSKSAVKKVEDLLSKEKRSTFDLESTQLNLLKQEISTQDSRANYLKNLSKLTLMLGLDPYQEKVGIE